MNLPDFDDMQDLAKEIASLTREEMMLEVEIKAAEAEITKTAMADPKYFQNGKAPSQAFINSAYMYTGFNNELVPKRQRLAEIAGLLSLSKMRMGFMKDMIEIWRTESANNRMAT